MAQTIDLIKNTSFESKMDTLTSAITNNSKNAYSIVVVGATSVPAITYQDTLTFIAGTNVTITPDAINKTITFSATGGGGGGATWYFGTAITGTSTTPTAYTTGITLAVIGDFYVNNGGGVDNGRMYQCTLGGDDTIALWKYVMTMGGSTDWSTITNKPTTISGYGITDAKIDTGVITLGSNTITPYTASNPQTNVSGSSGSCTGNSATATTLQTARTINGVSFDGSADITITAVAVVAWSSLS